MEMVWVIGFAVLVFTGCFLFVVVDKTAGINRETKLREALMWATAYLECNCKNSTKDMPDFLNAVALVNPGKDLVGPFQMLVFENEELREQIAKLS